MKTIALDVHTGQSQMDVVSEDGEVLLERQVVTEPEELRRAVAAVPGPKRVIFEEGPLSGLIRDALDGVADEVISCDPTRNALIARSEDSNDERDAHRLATLSRLGVVHEVFVPPEPYRTLRSLVHYDYNLCRAITSVKNQIKGMCRRQCVRYKGRTKIYGESGKQEALDRMPNATVRWQLESLYRRLEYTEGERQRTLKLISGEVGALTESRAVMTVPGMGAVTGAAVIAWIADPGRFKSRSSLSSYGGLGLGQGFTNWKPIGRARASKRGQRELKRALFMAARGALRGDNAICRRYRARIAAGWEDRKAVRDMARTILFTVCAVWKSGREYDDALVSVPETAGGTK